MAEEKSELVRSTEKRVREIFEAAGHAVSEAVGEQPGEVVFFAEEPRRTGRLRMHWVVWERCPEDLAGALDALEQERTRLGADRALAVLAQDGLPARYRHDLHANRVNAFTLRRFAFEILGVFDFLRHTAALPEDAPHHQKQFLPRRGITENGETVSAVEHIESLLNREGPWCLLVEGEYGIGRGTLLAHLVYRQARACLADPDHVMPLIVDTYFPITQFHTGRLQPVPGATLIAPDVGWLVEHYSALQLFSLGEDLPSSRFLLKSIGLEWHFLTLQGLHKQPVLQRSVYRLQLLVPEEHEVRAWYRSHLTEAAFAQLERVWERSADVAAIAPNLANLASVRMAALHATETSNAFPEWLARFIVHYVDHQSVLHEQGTNRAGEHARLVDQLEDAALEEFALGNASRQLVEIVPRLERSPAWRWFEQQDTPPSSWRYANRLIRDYFLARKIAREVREHGPDIFARYQFPQEHVLLFLAVIAPEVAAQATADRSAEMRARIQEEIEHQLQLTLAHQLKRSVGALRTNLGRVRRAMTEAVRAECSEDLARIDDELGFLATLAEKTRRWHEVPDERVESIAIHGTIDDVLSQLRDDHDGVEIVRDIAPDVIVRAGRHTLHEVLYCLLENAFHAASDPAAGQPPRIAVRAVHEGTDVVRIEVLDSGTGVDPGDRERIFEPRVTTKKGGTGRPLGTGMGLAIARKYARAIGGRVELDPDRSQTCFVLKLVAGGVDRE